LKSECQAEERIEKLRVGNFHKEKIRNEAKTRSDEKDSPVWIYTQFSGHSVKTFDLEVKIKFH
jgi:hypothetical protein